MTSAPARAVPLTSRRPSSDLGFTSNCNRFTDPRALVSKTKIWKLRSKLLKLYNPENNAFLYLKKKFLDLFYSTKKCRFLNSAMEKIYLISFLDFKLKIEILCFHISLEMGIAYHSCFCFLLHLAASAVLRLFHRNRAKWLPNHKCLMKYCFMPVLFLNKSLALEN